ncbi:MAG: DUF2089 domain-containing protein [Candidatus Latescibacteria bacterium]|nr:DUF2089 domain-containing protein [Candidatus Latescibacterota bacterium]
MRKILERCPSCGAHLEVTRLSCPSCGTVIEGHYCPCTFCKLSPDSLRFLEIFVRCRGNIKEMERELGISYPTIRNRLNQVIRELGYEVRAEEEPEIRIKRQEILQMLDDGRISPNEAAQMLKALKR